MSHFKMLFPDKTHFCRLAPFWQRFQDCRGNAAIEFALVAPLLITIYLGMGELTLGMRASRNSAHVASSIGDLAAQSDSLSAANINDLFNIGDSILAVSADDTHLQVRVSEVVMDTDNVAKVVWSQAQHTTGYSKDQPVSDITVDQLPVGSYLIMTEVTYNYTDPVTSSFADLLASVTTFKQVYYHHPRNGASVTYTG